MNKGYICEECGEPCYLTVVYMDGLIHKMPDNCPFGGYKTDWKEYKSGEDDE